MTTNPLRTRRYPPSRCPADGVGVARRLAQTLAGSIALVATFGACSAIAGTRAQPRVVGGATINALQVPYVAAVMSGPDFLCGGSLIAPDRVLTAAHCAPDLRVGDHVVVGGSQTRRIAHIAQDPRWTAHIDAGAATDAVLPYDVAILVLERPVSEIAPIRLARDADRALYAPGALLLFAGMGATNRDGYGYGVLRYAQLQARSDHACNALLGPLRTDDEFVASAMLCTTDPDDAAPYRAACYGDSGAPLVAWAADNAPVLVGIDDWGNECGFAGNDPSNFVEVPAIAAFALSANPVYRPEPRGRPRLTGTARVGQRMRCVTPRYEDPQPDTVKHGFFLRIGDSNRMIARGRTYTIARTLRGRRLTCAVLAHSAGGELVSAAAAIKRIRPAVRNPG